jgi:hypothetical protein
MDSGESFGLAGFLPCIILRLLLYFVVVSFFFHPNRAFHSFLDSTALCHGDSAVPV